MVELLQGLVDVLAQAPAPVVIAIAALLAGGESVLGVGYLVPGEVSVVVAAGVLVERDVAVVLWLVVAGCATAGDSLGWLMGRRAGSPLRRSRAVRRLGEQRWDQAADIIRRRGAVTVVVGRFLPVVRAMVPPVAGASGMPYRVFCPASMLGAAVQSAVLVTVGTLVGEAVVTAWPGVQDQLGKVAVVVLGAFVIGMGLVIPRPRPSAPTGRPGSAPRRAAAASPAASAHPPGAGTVRGWRAS